MNDVAVDDRTKRITTLNDALRTTCFGGTVMFTEGVRRYGPLFLTEIIEAIRTFDDFSDDNDPYSEHDFGKLDLAGRTLFWKIDHYDRNLEFASPDPADPKVTQRVLTVMLAEEY